MNKQSCKRERRRQHRKAFKKRCYTLEQRVNAIGLKLHWSRIRNEPRAMSSKFSLWLPNEYDAPIVKDFLIGEMEEYIDRCYKLTAFL